MLVYRLFRSLLRFATRVFFRRIEVVGREHLPAEGEAAVVFCGNHPNSLLDPVLITVFCGRVVHFAAKDVLFRSRLLRLFLGALGAVPVRRRKDHPEGPLDNEEAFASLFDVLGARRAIGIFPEGISHNRSQLQALKTGAARIALGASARHPDTPIVLVPTGLVYFSRHRFRSSVLVQFGRPITVDETWLARWTEDDRAAARELTESIETSLLALTVNAPDWETIWVLDGVRRLYQPPRIRLAERAELARRFNRYYPEVKDQPEVRSIYRRVRAYLVKLSALGLDDAQIRREPTTWDVVRRVARHLVLLLVWLPLAWLGALLHLPLGLLFGWAGERLAPRKDVVATTKFVIGLLVLGLVYAVIALAVGWREGWPTGLLVACLLPLSGHATVQVIARADALRNVVATLGQSLFLRREVAALRAEREELQAAVIAAVDQFRPEGLELLFPSGGRSA